MKLSDYAKKHQVTYMTAYRWYKKGISEPNEFAIKNSDLYRIKFSYLASSKIISHDILRKSPIKGDKAVLVFNPYKEDEFFFEQDFTIELYTFIVIFLIGLEGTLAYIGINRFKENTKRR